MNTTEEWISKKDLLTETGISYGQLYRWKRQNLIPEAWFVKQSSFTGQETYFPKQKMLQRIRKIIELKDLHSLEELSAMLNPQAGEGAYDAGEILPALGIGEPFLREYVIPGLKVERNLTFAELLIVYCVWRFRTWLSPQQWKEVQSTCVGWVSVEHFSQYQVYVFMDGANVHTLAVHGGADLKVDASWKLLLTVPLEQLSGELQEKLLKLA